MIRQFNNFLDASKETLEYLKENTAWDKSFQTRWTASYGVPYEYAGVDYAFSEFPAAIKNIAEKIKSIVQYEPNNCLINYYLSGVSKMGYHSDDVEQLQIGSDIIILSLGDYRTFNFKYKTDKILKTYSLLDNSLTIMSASLQKDWLHSVSAGKGERISVTFRKIAGK